MAAHWEPTLRIAFGSDWRAQYGSEVAAMLQLTTAAAQMPPPSAAAVAPAADAAPTAPALGLERPGGTSADTSPASYDHSRTDDEPCSLASCSETSTLESSGPPAERRGAQAEAVKVDEMPATTAAADSSVPADSPRLPAGSWGSGAAAAQPQPGVTAVAAPGDLALVSPALSSPLDAVFERCKTYLASVTQAAAAAAEVRDAMGPPSSAGPASLLGRAAPAPVGLTAGLVPLFTSVPAPTCASAAGRPQHAGSAGALEVTLSSPEATVAPSAAPPPLWQPTPALTAATGAPAPQLPAVPQSLLATNVLDGCDCWGRSPLMVAAAAGRLAVVRQLLAAGCSASKWLPVDYRSDLHRCAACELS